MKKLLSESHMKYFYHATVADALPSIFEKGLIPMDEHRWGGLLAYFSDGKVFVTTKFNTAQFYGNSGIWTNQEINRFRPILRLQYDINKLQKDEASEHDYYKESSIKVPFEIFVPDEDESVDDRGDTHYNENKGEWRPLTKGISDAIYNGEWDGEIIDYDENNSLDELSREEVMDNWGGPVNASTNVSVRLKNIDERNKYINFICVDNAGSRKPHQVRLKMADFKYLKNDRDLSDQNKVELALLNGELKYNCTCPSFKFGGFAYISGVYKSALVKEPRRPVRNNPEEQGVSCKHVMAVMEKLENFIPRITQIFTKFYKR